MQDDRATPAATAIVNPPTDVQEGPIGTGAGYSGEEYDASNHASERALKAGAEGGLPKTAPASGVDIPPDNGRRAFIDANGEVHGSGAGAGGGNEGEDFDDDSQNGDGYPLTGGER